MSLPFREKPSALSAAVSPATRTPEPWFVLDWASGTAKSGKLPDEMLKNLAHLAIYVLPQTFASLKMPMASAFANLWLYGPSANRSIESIPRKYPEKNIALTRFRRAEFSGSVTFNRVVPATLDKAIVTLKHMASVMYASDERWTALRAYAQKLIDKHRGKDVWRETTPDFEKQVIAPDLALEQRQIITDTYIANGEWPTSSDCYGAIGPFSVRSYLQADIFKKAGDDHIYVKPLKVGARVWDDYDFNDGNWKFGPIRIEIAQFLGLWRDKDTSETIILTNADFRSFRDQFMPAYNALKPTPKPQLVCQDYSSVSDYLVSAVTNPTEYPLPGMRAE